MTRRALLAFLLLASPAGAAERGFSVTSFDRIRLDAPYRVEVWSGVAPSAVAQGDARALDAVSVEVQGSTLVIRAKATRWGEAARVDGPVTLRVGAPAVRGVRVLGAGSLQLDRVRGALAELLVGGSGAIEAGAVEADRLLLHVSGTGRVAAAGRAKQLSVALQGSGTVDAGALEADDATVAMDGSGVARLRARRSAKVVAAGTGTVEVAGESACEVQARGSGAVTCGR